jgi:hypothetical protein
MSIYDNNNQKYIDWHANSVMWKKNGQ